MVDDWLARASRRPPSPVDYGASEAGAARRIRLVGHSRGG